MALIKKVEQLFSTWEEKALAFEAAAMDVDATFDPSLQGAATAAAFEHALAARAATALRRTVLTMAGRCEQRAPALVERCGAVA